MAKRVKVEDLRTPEQLQPKATPVNTFVTPYREHVQAPAQGLSAMQQLSKSLAAFAPELQKLSFRYGDQYKARQIEEGEILASRAKNMEEWEAAVKSGQVPSELNPWQTIGRNRQWMRQIANQYDMKIRTGYLTSEVANSEDPTKLQAWMDEQRAEILNKDLIVGFDPRDVEQILMTRMEATEKTLMGSHVSKITKRIEEGLFNGVEDNTANLMAQLNTTLASVPSESELKLRKVDPDGAPVPQQLTKETVLARYSNELNTLVAEAWSHGAFSNPEKLKKSVVDAVDNLARETENHDLYDVLDKITWGPGGTLGGTSYAKGKAAAGRKAINQGIIQYEEVQHRRETRRIDREQNDVLIRANIDLKLDPNADTSDFEAQLIRNNDYEGLAKLRSDKEHAQRQSTIRYEDPNQKAQFWNNVINDKDTQDDWRDGSKNLSAETLESAMKFKNSKNKGEIRDYKSTINKLIRDFGGPLKSGLKPQFSFDKDYRAAAVSEFSRRMREHEEWHRNQVLEGKGTLPSYTEEAKWAEVEAERIKKKYQSLRD